ncbi:MAG: PAS domain S-box protein, partial [Thermoplasmatota archaeon]
MPEGKRGGGIDTGAERGRLAAEKRLRDGEETFRRFFERMRDALYISTRDGTFLDVNQAMLDLLGYDDKAELCAIDIPHDFYDSPAEREHLLQEIARRGYAQDYEVTVKKRDGTALTVLETCHERYDDSGTVIGYEGIIRDITERKREENIQSALYRISEAVHSTRDFDDLLQTIHGIIDGLMPARNFFIALYDAETGMYSLPYFVDEYGERPPADRLRDGMTGYVLRTGRSLLATPETVRRLVEDGKIERISTPSVCWLGVPLRRRGASIGVLAVQSYTEDVGYDEADRRVLEFVSAQVGMAIERKKTEEELRLSEESYRELFDNATEAIYIQDREGRFVDVNEGAVEMYGYPHDFFIGETPEVLAAPGKNDMEATRRWVRRAFEGIPQQFEFWGRRSNGEVFPKDVRLSRGSFFGQEVVFAFARDVTERVRREKGIRQLNEVLGLTNKILRHDIMNDLNVIRGAVELYMEDGNPGMLDRVFARIDKSVGLIRRMTDLESLIAPQGPLGAYDARGEIQEVLDTYDVAATVTGSGRVQADDAFHSVIDNVIRNAVVHGGTDRVDVDISTDGDTCEIRVADEGSGIPDEIKQRVFEERFSHGSTGGSG